MKNKKGIGFVLWSLSLLFVLPVVSAALEYRIQQIPLNGAAVGRWFIFWTTGIQLFFAGIKRASSPQFTAMSLFSLKSRESYLVLMELGFANMALGAMGILSVINDQWRLIAAIAGGLYFALTCVLQFFKGPGSRQEWIVLLYNMIVFFGLLSFLIFQ